MIGAVRRLVGPALIDGEGSLATVPEQDDTRFDLAKVFGKPLASLRGSSEVRPGVTEDRVAAPAEIAEDEILHLRTCGELERGLEMTEKPGAFDESVADEDDAVARLEKRLGFLSREGSGEAEEAAAKQGFHGGFQGFHYHGEISCVQCPNTPKGYRQGRGLYQIGGMHAIGKIDRGPSHGSDVNWLTTQCFG